MTEADDIELLRQYAGENSEPAFAALVGRHINFVYSVALRRTGDPHAAEEITQAVFIILARKAKSFSRKTILTGWLHSTARLTAANFLRAEIRRQQREQEAFMQSAFSEPETWTQIAPLLDDAIAKLGERDRNAILLRYFENKSAREMAAALRVDEPAAQKRVTRAVEKLRAFFAKHGVTLTAAAIAGAVSANSVQAAPVGLAATVTAAAAKGAAVSASTLTLIKGAMKIMAWTKVQTAIITTAVVVLAAGTATVAVKDFSPKKEKPRFETSLVTDSVMDTYLAKDNLTSTDPIYKAPAVLSVQATHFPHQTGCAIWFDLPDTNLVQGLGRNMPLASVLQAAYGFESTRMVLPKNLPDTNFDFMATLPNCSRKAFQDEIEQKLGLRGYPEVVHTDVFLLKVKNADALGLKISITTAPGWRQQWGDTVYCATNLPISDLGASLEQTSIKQPVIDETGLTDKFDIDIEWESHDNDSLKKVLLDQLGLELVPTNMPIEMLVVEKVRNN